MKPALVKRPALGANRSAVSPLPRIWQMYTLHNPCSCQLTTHIVLTGSVAMRLQVFDDKNQFAEWFGDSFGKTAPGAGGEDDVAMEKRVVVIHRLHQILEPFMLRRQVQDVEGKLPPKVTSIASVVKLLGQQHAPSNKLEPACCLPACNNRPSLEIFGPT